MDKKPSEDETRQNDGSESKIETSKPSEAIDDEEETSKSDDRVRNSVIEQEMQSSYLDYAMSVIVGRALPDVRDGLKPVHRRILFAMNDLGMFSNKPSKKSARIVGEVIGKYHPHGDSAVYESMVRMAQSFALRYPLIQGQGNFGSIDGDSAAAMRYTEAKLSKAAEALLEDINKDTIDFQPNFDGELKEPTVLPSKLPNLLINGSSGIAVGMATNIPPHNMGEVIDGTIATIDNPAITTKELMEYIKGPDFPTGGIICGRAGILSAFERGKGRLRIRARTEIEDYKNKQRIIINEIPYQVNKAQTIVQIADLVHDKVIPDISDIRDESDKDGMRVVIELKQDANTDVVLNKLFKHSRLEVTFGVIMLSLVDKEPKVLSLKENIQYYVQHRQHVIRRRSQFELRKAEERAHILEGLIIALDNIDDIIKKIKKSKNAESARQTLVTDYKLSELQAKAILDMKLQKLSSLEQGKIRVEHKDLMILIEELKSILASEQKILDIIKAELLEMKEKFADKRRTQILDIDVSEEIDMEDLIEEETVVVTVSKTGYIKRQPLETYKKQGRGGKGIIGTKNKDEDFVEHIFISSTHSYVLFFSDKGQVYWLKVYNLPEGSRQAKGKAIVNLIGMAPGEGVSAFIPVKEFDEDHFLVFATKNGQVKKTSLDNFARPRKGGIRAITLNDNDELIGVKMTDGKRDVMLASKNGMAIKFNEQDVRPMGRTAAGVRGINLRKGDEAIGMIVAEHGRTIFTVTENGYGKRTDIDDYRTIGRGGVGVINIICSSRNGKVVSVKSVSDDDELMLISQNGLVIRTSAKGISLIGRNTQGVRVMGLNSDDRVVASATIISD